jgi:hypothetical protein
MSPSDRQRVERVPGARRARLTPAPGTDLVPEAPEDDDAPAAQATGASGPNDERMRLDVPPHY